jgi:hypothetical protein
MRCAATFLQPIGLFGNPATQRRYTLAFFGAPWLVGFSRRRARRFSCRVHRQVRHRVIIADGSSNPLVGHWDTFELTEKPRAVPMPQSRLIGLASLEDEPEAVGIQPEQGASGSAVDAVGLGGMLHQHVNVAEMPFERCAKPHR